MVGALRWPIRPLIPTEVGLPSVNARGIMAGAARYGPVRRQATVEEQFLAEGDFLGGLRIVRRYRGACRGSRDSDLMNGLRVSQRPGFGDRQLFQNGRTLPPNREQSGSQDAHERDAHRHGASHRGSVPAPRRRHRRGSALEKWWMRM